MGLDLLALRRELLVLHRDEVLQGRELAWRGRRGEPAAGTEDQDMDWANGLMRDIINVQNHQIQQMQGWLEANAALAEANENCYADGVGVDAAAAPEATSDACPGPSACLSGGAIAGIVIGAFVGLLAIAAGLYFYKAKKSTKVASGKKATSAAEA